MLPATYACADEADDQFAVAAGHYDAKRWKLAAEEFQTYLNKYPTHPRVAQSFFFQAEAFLQLGQYEAAHAKLQEYLKRDPQGDFVRPAMFRSGEAAFLAGKNESAEKELVAFIKKYPDDRLNAFALPYLGDMAAGKKEYPLAESYYREALKRFPQGSLRDDCSFGLARALEKQNKNDEAERLYLALSRKTASPLADNAQFHHGALLYAGGKYAEALETFQALEKQWPQSSWKPNARLLLGGSLIKLKRLEEASAIFQSLAADPKLGIEARYWLGLVQKTKQEWHQAAKTLLETADAAAGHELLSAIRFHAGDALLQAGDTEAAIKQFDLVLGEKANLAPAAREAVAVSSEWLEQALRGKIHAALLRKNYASVESDAENFAKRFPSSPLRGDVERMLARSLLEQKQYDRAVAVLEPRLTLKPPKDEELEIRYLLAAAEEGLRKYDQALETLAPVANSASGRLQADAQLLQGSLLLAMKRYAEATPPLEAYLRSNPTGDGIVQSAGQLAISYARSGHLDKAKKFYADLRQKYPKHPLLAPATEQLAEAAFDADDAAWSAELSSILAEMGKQKSAESRSAAKPHDLTSTAPAAESNDYEIKGLAGLGWSQYKAGQMSEAAATFDQVLQKQPPDALAAEITYVRGQILEKLEQFDSALSLYDRVVEKYPKSAQHADALYAAARLRAKLQQTREAAVLYEKLARDYPKYAKLDAALYDWAWALRDLDKPEEADKLYTRLREEFPKSRYWADATYRLAERAWEAQDAAQANSLLDELLAGKAEPSLREFALSLRAQIALAGKDWNKIRLAFEELSKEFPESKQRLLAEFWIAESYYRSKDYDEAEKRFESLSQQTPGRQESWMAMIALRRAQISLYRKKWDAAYTLATSVEKDFPDFEQQYEAELVIGRCLANRAEFEEARKAYQKVIGSPAGAKTETAAMAQWLIGETYFHQKNFEAALREYLRVEILYAYPAWQSLSLIEAAKCHELLGDNKEAEKCYRQILERYRETPSAKDAKQRLDAMKKELEKENKKA
jgi:TolA-binding protein